MHQGKLPDLSASGQSDMVFLQNGASALNKASPTDDLDASGLDVPVAHAEVDYEDDDMAYRSNDEEESRLVQNNPRAPRKVSEKKRIEQANFGKWLENNRASLTKKAGKRATDNEQSIEYMVKNWEGESIINKPRDYQLELFERAKENNTIAVLDTGSGKTLIAVLLLQHIINQELEDRAKGLPRRLSFFLVDKVALVYQQHAVLDCNLGHSVAAFSGESVQYTWNKRFWKEQFAKHEVIVCTAEILNKCLQYAYIRINQINLLIFDEAHHTKKNHPYARIIKDYYAAREASGCRLPRIFGMTASPVDAQVDVRLAAMELEGLLHAQIATTRDPTALRRTVSKPKKEVLATYSRLIQPQETEITAKLRAVVGSNKLFRRAFAFAVSGSRELGTWFADRMWQLVLHDDELLRIEAKTERNFVNDMASPEVVNKHKKAVQTARELVEKHEFREPREHLLSSKVHLLLRLLRDFFKDPKDKIRCIIFVEMRWTVKLLENLLQHSLIEIPALRVGVLMGANKEDGYSQTSFRQQLMTIIKFKSGELNCILATSVAEEGLDLPDCNLIIRFDLYKTMIQYIQSRGRARQAQSTYVHMIEEGNGDHRRRISQNIANENLLRQVCDAVPEDRQLKGSDFDMEYYLRKERNQRQYTIKSSGAKITYKNSMSVLGDFLNSLCHQDDFTSDMRLTADFVILPVEGGFQCEVVMPVISPVSGTIGKVHSTKQVAKCSAAFEVCMKLVSNKFLDENLRSKLVERRNKMANARLAVSSKKRAKYDMRLKPKLWDDLGMPERLHAAVLILSEPRALGRPSRPLLMLTRKPLPQIKSFPLYFGPPGQHGMSSELTCRVLNISMDPTDEDLQLFSRFTLKLFVDIFNKRYLAIADEMPYFFAPANRDHRSALADVSSLRKVIDWSLLRSVLQTDALPYTGDESEDFYVDKYIVDPHDGSRRFWLRGIRKDLTPHSPVPDDVEHFPGYRQWKRAEVSHDILNWSVTSWKATREAREMTWNEKQPVVVGLFASLRRDFLSEMEGDRKNPFCYFVLEPLRISPIPVDVVAMAYLIPSIIHRIEQNLIALDACKLLKLDIHPDLALEALTKDSENQCEDDGKDSIEAFEPVNFQPGMGNNYERLEFLGDSFLKMATTISVFTLMPNKDEFEYHVERMIMICNQNLFGVARSNCLQLEEYIRAKAFSRSTWYPNLKLEFGKTHQRTLKNMDSHSLADKSIADVCEALIGAAYMTTRKDNDYNMAIEAVTRLTNHKHHPMMRWEDYYAAYTKPTWQVVAASAAELEMAKKIEKVTEHKFKYPRLLRSAFVHPSRPYLYDKVPNYQRLEFLGDALLDMVCVDYLFHMAPDKGPQWLTEHKMAMVSNQFLGCIAVSLGFHKYLLHNGMISDAIVEYVTEITEARRVAEDAAQAAGKPRSEFAKDYWVEVRQPPKCIPDVLEAYIGAIFVDSEYEYSTVQRFFSKHIQPYFSNMRIYDTFANKHPVTFCTQFIYDTFGCHAYSLQSEEIQIMDDEGSWTGSTKVAAGILIHGQVVDGTVRESGRYAKVAAARKALAKLKGMTKEDFMKEFGCDCKPGEAAADISESATAI
ncbi:Dicer-like protein 1 [Cytospora mali]|uniref:Dicer-like protein 1 n=1 Tax=Cytospora mali TaxID=578113 RepID=A0A194UYY0_CYTMA|nr:Dicer-like protein 1 [Valsa mali var. pyri (nom. inval.)]